MMKWLMIFLGGGVGSLLRYGVGELTAWFYNGKFPMGTLFANVLSCFILGCLAEIWLNRNLENPVVNYLFVIGLCGGFSTFSAFSLQNFGFMEMGKWHFFWGNIVISTILGIVCIYFGMIFVKWVEALFF